MRSFFENHSLENREFILKTDLPFNIRFTPVYEFMLALQLYGSIQIPIAHVSTDLFFLSLGFILIEYLRMLQKSFQSAINAQDSKEIKRLIEIHKKIINFRDSYNEVFIPITFTGYVLNVIMASIFGYQVIEVK